MLRIDIIFRLLSLGIVPLIIVTILNIKIYCIIQKSRQIIRPIIVRKSRVSTTSTEMFDIMDLKEPTALSANLLSRKRGSSFREQPQESITRNDERILSLTLFSVISVFITCHLPWVVMLLHHAIIIERIK